MTGRRIPIIVALAFGLSGCLANTIGSVVTAPVRVAGKAADWATTSQSEADRNRGRALRHREEQLGRLDHAYRASRFACDRGDAAACTRARTQYAQIRSLAPTIPAEP